MLESIASYMFTRCPYSLGRFLAGHRRATIRGRSLSLMALVCLSALLPVPGWTQASPDARTALPEANSSVLRPGEAPDLAAMSRAQLSLALADNRRQQRELLDLKLRLAAAESATQWLPWLMLGVVGLGGLGVWLGLRLRRLLGDQKRREWAAAEAELHASLMPDAMTSASAPLLSADVPLLSAAPGKLPASASNSAGALTRNAMDSFAEASRADRTLTPPPDVTPRAVTVEELLDLDQQVDFFMVLGQEQAAIDLLLGHVRATGGVNALPYIKLLEIYRQLGDEEAYERTRERFNQRFNAQAPGFDGDLLAGRQLEDYPALMSRLERAWPQPIRALAELDGLLLRRADLEVLDLPAFHDLLTLHAMVRDLPVNGPARDGSVQALPSARPDLPVAETERAQALVSRLGRDYPEAGTVDLLLPFDTEPLDVTQPQPRLASPGSTRAMVADWMQARSSGRSSGRSSEVTVDASWQAEPVARSQRLDLDLTEHAPAPREFTRPAAFTELGVRRDARPSGLSVFDDSDLLPPSISRH